MRPEPTAAKKIPWTLETNRTSLLYRVVQVGSKDIVAEVLLPHYSVVARYALPLLRVGEKCHYLAGGSGQHFGGNLNKAR